MVRLAIGQPGTKISAREELHPRTRQSRRRGLLRSQPWTSGPARTAGIRASCPPVRRSTRSSATSAANQSFRSSRNPRLGNSSRSAPTAHGSGSTTQGHRGSLARLDAARARRLSAVTPNGSSSTTALPRPARARRANASAASGVTCRAGICADTTATDAFCTASSRSRPRRTASPAEATAVRLRSRKNAVVPAPPGPGHWLRSSPRSSPGRSPALAQSADHRLRRFSCPWRGVCCMER